MSAASKRGHDLENRIAKQIRRILRVPAYRDRRSGAGQTYKADIAAPGFAFSVEAKSQQTIKLREWWAQAVAATPSYKLPMLVIAPDEYHELAVVRLEDILSLVRQNQDDSQELTELKSGIH